MQSPAANKTSARKTATKATAAKKTAARAAAPKKVAGTPAKTVAAPASAREDLVDALLSASRAMVALAARSLANLDAEVTLPQYRALVVLASRGPQRVVDISTELGVNPSTGTRMCDRLARKGLIRRARSGSDRRALRLSLTAAGRRLVEEVTERRREELERLVDETPMRWHRPVTRVLRSLAESAGEVPEREWWLGSTSPDPANVA